MDVCSALLHAWGVVSAALGIVWVLALVQAIGAALCAGMGGSDTSAAGKKWKGLELARLQASWGRMGSTHSAKGTGSEWGVSLCVDGVSDAVGDVEEHGDNMSSFVMSQSMG